MHTTLMYIRYLDNDLNTPSEDNIDGHVCDVRVTLLVHSEEALHLPYQSLTYDTVSMILKYQATDFEVLGFSGAMYINGDSIASYFIPTGTRLYPYSNDGYDYSTGNIWSDETSDAGYILDVFFAKMGTGMSGVIACDIRIASTHTVEVQNVHAGTSRMVTTSGAGCKVPYKVSFEEIPEQQEIPEYEPYVPYVHPWRNPNMDCYNYNGDPTVSCDSSHIGTSGSFIQSGECV